MWIAIIGIIIGVLIGLNFPYLFGGSLIIYVSVAMMAGFDSLLGAIRSHLDHEFNGKIFITGFVSNVILAGLLAYIGDNLGLPLYYAALFVFGTRLFNNLAMIRRHLLSKYTGEKF